MTSSAPRVRRRPWPNARACAASDRRTDPRPAGTTTTTAECRGQSGATRIEFATEQQPSRDRTRIADRGAAAPRAAVTTSCPHGQRRHQSRRSSGGEPMRPARSIPADRAGAVSAARPRAGRCLIGPAAITSPRPQPQEESDEPPPSSERPAVHSSEIIASQAHRGRARERSTHAARSWSCEGRRRSTTLRARIDRGNFFAAVVDERRPQRHARHRRGQAEEPVGGRDSQDFDPVAIARQYEEAGAAAISCLTDEKYFGGHLGYIQADPPGRPAAGAPQGLHRRPVPDLGSRAPPAPTRAPHRRGPQRIAQLLDMMILARDLGMTSLVEDPRRRKPPAGPTPHRLPALPGYSLLGINNRDLKSMTTDVSHTMRMRRHSSMTRSRDRLRVRHPHAATTCVQASDRHGVQDRAGRRAPAATETHPGAALARDCWRRLARAELVTNVVTPTPPV